MACKCICSQLIKLIYIITLVHRVRVQTSLLLLPQAIRLSIYQNPMTINSITQTETSDVPSKGDDTADVLDVGCAVVEMLIFVHDEDVVVYLYVVSGPDPRPMTHTCKAHLF